MPTSSRIISTFWYGIPVQALPKISLGASFSYSRGNWLDSFCLSVGDPNISEDLWLSGLPM